MRPSLYLSKAFILLLLSLLSLTACSLLNRGTAATVLGHDTQLGAGATLICSQVCAERGQCGTAVDQGEVILGGHDQPRLAQQNVLFPVSAAITVLETSSYNVRQLSGGDPFPINFYKIATAEGKIGWVAGWCLAAPPTP